MAALEINALGAFEVWAGGVRGSAPSRAKAKALLAYLALQRGTPVSRERLIEIFWPDADPRAGRANLNTALWDVRRALRKTGGGAEDALTTTQPIAQLAGDVSTDVASFVSLAASGKEEMLRKALDLYRGDFLEGDYCEWSIAQRETLAGTFEDVQARLLWSSRDPALARGLIERNPYHEEAYAILIEHELQASRLGAAREMAARARTAMAEVDVIPSGALARALRAAAGSEIGRRPSSQIPTLLTTYLGREAELGETNSAMRQTRLLTLTGPGGVGKTRLAIRLAAEIADRFPEGAWFVDLARVEDQSLVPHHLCQTIGLPGELPSSPEIERVAGALAQARALLILDNCEHLAAGLAPIVTTLLTRCPSLHILATSRVPLAVPGENIYHVPPLSAQDAAALFVDRARLVERSFAPASVETVRAICARLDRLPFAIEIAASRVAIMTLDQLLAEIEQRFEVLSRARRTPEVGRHVSLDELVGWSYSLLPQEEQTALRLCAVFPYDFSLEAFAAACAESVSTPARGFEVLLSLTSKSLVLSEPSPSGKRYRLLETTKAFCRERLIQNGHDEQARRRHAVYFCEYALAMYRTFASGDVESYMRAVYPERENMHAALTWMLEAGKDAHVVVEFIGALLQYWRESGEFDIGRAWAERAMAELQLDEGDRAWLCICSALLAQGSGNFRDLKTRIEEASVSVDAIADPSKRALFSYARALSLLKSGEHREAQTHLTAALEQARSASNLVLTSDALNALANVALQHTGELERGRELYEEALRIARAAHASKRAAVILLNLGMLFEEDRDFDAAIAVTQEAIEICDRLGGQPLLDSALAQLATYEDGRGDFAAARARLREALDFVRARSGAQDRVAFVLLLEGYVAVAEHAGRLEEAGLVLGFSAAFRELNHIGPDQARFGGTFDAAMERMSQILGTRSLDGLRARGRLLGLERVFEILERL